MLDNIQEELEVPPDIDFRVIVNGRQRRLPRDGSLPSGGDQHEPKNGSRTLDISLFY
jgi:hypothetical protein